MHGGIAICTSAVPAAKRYYALQSPAAETVWSSDTRASNSEDGKKIETDSKRNRELGLFGWQRQTADVKYVISPMEWNIYANMKEEDVRAMYRYLRTIKPIPNQVPANIPPK